MNFFIEVKNGQTINHPAYESNLLQAFGVIPNNWEPFIRVERPTLDVYQVLENDEAIYIKVDGVWTDLWNVRDMTSEERTTQQQATIDAFNSREQAENWAAWTLDEEACTMQPPIPRPEPDEAKLTQRIMTFWCGADNNWKDTPVLPEGNYKFDFFAWQWVEVTE